MDDEIQLGELAQAEPQTSIRPDQDAHFSTKVVGQTDSDDLAIFVDLDVQRDMEAHALSNTNVELGGVLMGRQFIDHAGKPFVVISDCLRATHFEATKGTFKFTHETWREITRQREGFRPDLEMVGWYHTHPDWGVFLSGMDLFICNNFFNRALDVALVIDPCKQDRGWFHWTTSTPRKKRQTQGFILTTNRLRCAELEQYANFYNKEPVLNQDPRYSLQNTNPSPVVVMENRRTISEISIAGMLVMQFIFLCFLSYNQWSGHKSNSVAPSLTTQSVAAQSQLDANADLSAKENAYREILTTIVAHETGYPQLVDKYTQLRVSQNQLQSSYQNQQLLIDNLTTENSAYQAALDQQQQAHAQKLSELLKTQEKTKEALEKKIQQSPNQDMESKLLSSSLNQIPSAWYWAIFGGVGVVILATGFVINQSGRKNKFNAPVASPLTLEPTEKDSSPNASQMFFVDHPPNTMSEQTDRELQS
ncbi:Mov34/MPN/PAD-1 family protein [Mariniblastus sp.]|nr:Mov34/MPN/PAD-1 family protein [Mariniblastus sp.]